MAGGVKAYRLLEHTSHPHIIQPNSVIKHNKDLYVMFQWADGGSLQVYYEQTPRPSLSVQLIKETFGQLRGIAHAIYDLHTHPSRSSIDISINLYNRWPLCGYLEPGRILRFMDTDSSVGVWKISDNSMAEYYTPTSHMNALFSHRVQLYTPPEVRMPGFGANFYDTWAMGCIMLELIIWLLYGFETLKQFRDSLDGRFWYLDHTTEVTQVHPTVAKCIRSISEDPACSEYTAVRDLLQFIQRKLLVIQLPFVQNMGEPERTGKSGITYRATAKDLHDALEEIYRKGDETEMYWFSGSPRKELAWDEFLKPDNVAISQKDINMGQPGSTEHIIPRVDVQNPPSFPDTRPHWWDIPEQDPLARPPKIEEMDDELIVSDGDRVFCYLS